MFEVVNGLTRESDGYFRSYVEAVEFGLTGEPGSLFEVWTVADDAARTRMVLHGRHRVRPASADLTTTAAARDVADTLGQVFGA